ncbi:MAG: hypothetical protein FJ304_27475 [Planctomycetes bacterium]|nr:hypothetical protein [Planctomycetota bacterium]
MARTVVVHPDVHTDLIGYAQFISQRVSRASATRWRAAIEATDADQHPEADEAAALGIDLRQQLHGKRPHVYRFLFTIDGETVNVLRVRHASQDHLATDGI